MDLQLSVNVLMVAHYFTIEVSPSNYKLRFSPIPSMKPSRGARYTPDESSRIPPHPERWGEPVTGCHGNLQVFGGRPTASASANAESAIGARVAGL